MISRLTYPTLLLALGLLAGSVSGAETAAAGASTDYVLQPSDLIRVMIFQEPDLQREVRLSQECSVLLPLIGNIDLKGKTLRQAEALIGQLYDKDYLVNPQVSIMILEYAKLSVSVLGSVNTPGPVALLPEQSMGLLDGVARAGGFSRLADRKHVKLVRTMPDGKTETYLINADDLIQTSKSGEKWLLQKDDVIFVPERLF